MAKFMLQSALLRKLPCLEHGFAAEAPYPLILPKQVHGQELAWVRSFAEDRPTADAVATLSPGLRIGVQSADCVPILVVALNAATHLPHAILAIHAGWRGSAAGIAQKTVTEFVLQLRKLRQAPDRLLLAAVIGPCIQGTVYQVGQDVAERFSAAKVQPDPGQAGKYLLDLPAENKTQLEAAAATLGVEIRTEDLQICTLSDDRRLPSFRRDGPNAGRLVSYLQLLP